MPSPSPMPPSAEKTQTLSRQPRCTPIPCHPINRQMESVQGTLMLPIANGTRNAKSLMTLMRRWKSRMMTTREPKPRLHVRLVALSEYTGFTIRLPKAETSSTVPQQVSMPTARLLCTNLPQEVTDDVLSVLFQQYVFISLSIFSTFSLSFRHPGLKSIQVTWSPTPNAAGVRVKMAQVLYENPDLATTAKEALNGFLLKKGWQMSVAYI